MSKGFKHGSTSPLNFKVVQYATEEELKAATPRENTIGVITNTDITSWVFSSTEPSQPENGMVWFTIGSNSAFKFNAIRKNVIEVYPKAAKQYIAGKWDHVVAKSYQTGNWANWDKYLFYYSSQDYEWYCSNMPGVIASNHEGVAPHFTKNENGSVTITGATGSHGPYFGGIYRLSEAFDFTNVDKLVINVSNVTGGSATVFPTYADAWSNDSSWGGDSIAGTSLGDGDNILDVSGVSGANHFGIGVSAGVTFTLNSIRIVEAL